VEGGINTNMTTNNSIPQDHRDGQMPAVKTKSASRANASSSVSMGSRSNLYLSYPLSNTSTVTGVTI
jgi:hypothetical protein